MISRRQLANVRSLGCAEDEFLNLYRARCLSPMNPCNFFVTRHVEIENWPIPACLIRHFPLPQSTHLSERASGVKSRTRFSPFPCDHMVWQDSRWSRTNAQRLSYQSRLPVFAFNGFKGLSWNLKYEDYLCHSSFGHWAHKCAVEHKLNSEQAFFEGVNLGAVQVFLAHLTTLPVQLSPFPISYAPCITR